MRTAILCALAILGGAEAAYAQHASGYAFGGGNGPPPGAFGVANNPAGGMAGGYAPAYQGYPGYPGAGYYPAYAYPGYYPYAYPGAMPMMPLPAAASDGGGAVPGAPESACQDAGATAFGPPASVAAAEGADDSPPYKDFYRPTTDHMWTSAEYSMVWLRSQRLNAPLVTTGSAADPHAAAVGQPGTSVLFGNNDISFGMYDGVRADIGFFLDDCDHLSLDVGGLWVPRSQVHSSLTSDAAGNPIIARPVFNAVLDREAAFVDSFPGLASGGYNAVATSEFVEAEINARYHVYGLEHLHLDALFGFRYMRLGESLTIQDQLRPLVNNTLTFEGAPVTTADMLGDSDYFRTVNNFYGLQVGGEVSWEDKWFFITGYWKVAVGANDQQTDINGVTTLTTPGGTQTATGGILALPSNIGEHVHTVVSFAPEGGFNFGFNLTPHIQLLAGYSFMYWNEVVRPGGSIDPAVNPGRIPSDSSFGQVTGPARPIFANNEQAFWVQSVNVGVQIHY